MGELLDPAYSTRSMERETPHAGLRPSALFIRAALALLFVPLAAAMDPTRPAFAILAAIYLATEGVACLYLSTERERRAHWTRLAGGAGLLAGLAALFFPPYLALGAWCLALGILHVIGALTIRSEEAVPAGTGTLFGSAGVGSALIGIALIARVWIPAVSVFLLIAANSLLITLALARLGFVVRRYLRRSETVPPFEQSDFPEAERTNKAA